MPNNVTITKLEARIMELESELALTKAIIDGSEAFTREATGYTIALLARYLHEKELIDVQDLLTYVERFKGDPKDAEDYHGEVVNIFAGCLKFQMKHPEDFILSAAQAHCAAPAPRSQRSGQEPPRAPIAHRGQLHKRLPTPGSARSDVA
jgi:hypothetical protein